MNKRGGGSRASMWWGMDFFAWLRLAARNRFAVSPSRLPRALMLTPLSLSNTVLRWTQNAWLGRRIGRVQIAPEPVFIVGHWRTGTTMLHELLDLDPNNRCPSTYESLVPNHFLISERWVRRLMAPLMPRKRPMDNMRVGFDRPQEDEVALCNMGVPSPFLTVAFPNRPLQHPRYVDFEELTAAERDRWEQALRRFLKQLLYKRPGRLVLKSPQHTCRVKHLARMFPQARFIHLVRDPFVLFSSTVHFWTSMYEAYGFQKPRLDGIHEFVFETLLAMDARLEEARELLEPGRLVDLRYEDLVQNPVAVIQSLYKSLEWPDFDSVRAALEHYAERSKHYRTNRYECDPLLHAEIARRWAPYFERYGYPVGPRLCSSPL